MNRKGFMKIIGTGCLCSTSLFTLISGCSAAKMIRGNIVGDELVVELSDFYVESGSDKNFKRYIIILNELLKYPICVYRFNQNEYSALWMRCTHQGNELQVFGEKLQCSAHGSEFDNQGSVKNGPADKSLRIFPVTIDKSQIRISLKAI
jgi:Rieske Fe-S protein